VVDFNSFLTSSEVILNTLAVVLLVFLNGFFVAAEFAIVKVRASQIESLLQKKDRRARLVNSVIHHLDAYLSATQLGITLCSLGLGWVGEPFVAHMLYPLFHLIKVESPTFIRSLAFGVGFGFITFLHIVLGELAPKSISIQRPQRTALFVTTPLVLFYKLFYPAIWFLNWSAGLFLKCLRIQPVAETERLHSEEELRILLGNIQKGKNSIVRNIQVNAFALKTLHVRNIMLPRNRIVSLFEELPFAENYKIAQESRHTRFPLCRKDLDHITGMVHIKDLLSQAPKTGSFQKQDLIRREIIFIPEYVTLESLLMNFLESKCHMAIIVDEFGGTLGMVTLEDVLEEVVGEIQDEFDQEQPLLRKVIEGEYLIDGAAPIHFVEESLEVHFPNRQDATTIGGYIVDLFRNIPPEGAIWVEDGWEVKVEKVDKFRVLQLHLRKTAPSLPQ
jgi:CBS domain containing-hemolysin-like protein